MAVQSSLQATFQLIGSMEIIDNEYRNQTKNIAYNADFDLIGFKMISFLKMYLSSTIMQKKIV